MTQPYGQQPGNYGQQPPSGYPQQSGGYPSPPGGFPQAPGYSTPPGGLPQAPPEYGAGSGPIPRPGTATAAAVLGFVQAGITTITTLLLFLGLANAGGDADAIGWLLALGQTAGIVLLIWGGVQLMSGRGRMLFVAGAVVEILVSLVYIIRFATADAGGFQLAEDIKSAGVFIAILFAVMPAIGLIMAMGGAVTQYVQSRR